MALTCQTHRDENPSGNQGFPSPTYAILQFKDYCVNESLVLQDDKVVGVNSLIIASVTQNPVNLRGLSPNDLP